MLRKPTSSFLSLEFWGWDLLLFCVVLFIYRLSLPASKEAAGAISLRNTSLKHDIGAQQEAKHYNAHTLRALQFNIARRNGMCQSEQCVVPFFCLPSQHQSPFCNSWQSLIIAVCFPSPFFFFVGKISMATEGYTSEGKSVAATKRGTNLIIYCM